MQKKSPNHKLQVVYRSTIWALASLRLGNGDWKLMLTYFVGFHLAFEFPFTVGLNKMRGKNWNYVGETAFTDVIFNDKPEVVAKLTGITKWLNSKLAGKESIYFGFGFLFMLMGIGFLIWPTGY